MTENKRPKRKLHVRKARATVVSKTWGLANIFTSDWVFIMCNKSGEFDWSKSPVYNASELVERDNVYIVGEVIR